MSTGISISSINRIKELAEEKKYAEALEILDTQDLDKSINPQFLKISGEIFRENKRYYDSRRILLKAHEMAPQGTRIIAELIQLHLSLGHFELAQKYYDEYLFYASDEDTQREFVEYIMKKATGKDIKELASIIIPILERIPEDKWNFEAVLLYDKLDRKDKALEEAQFILENFKDSVYVKQVIEYIDDKLDVDKYFYVYPKEAKDDDPEIFGELIEREAKLLEKDHLMMYPPEPRIMVMEDDNDAPEAKPNKSKNNKAKSNKKKSDPDTELSDQDISDKEKSNKKNKEKKNIFKKNKEQSIIDQSNEQKTDDKKIDTEKTINETESDKKNTGTETKSDKIDDDKKYTTTGKNDKLSEDDHQKSYSDESSDEVELRVVNVEEEIKREREAALERLLAKRLDKSVIKESAKQMAKAVNIDADKAKGQVKNVTDSVKDNVKKATETIGEVVVGTSKLQNSKAEYSEEFVDGIIESVISTPKKSVGQVVTNEELDNLVPDSLEAMSADEVAEIAAKKEEQDRLELEALEASLKQEKEKKNKRKKNKSDDSQESVNVESDQDIITVVSDYEMDASNIKASQDTITSVSFAELKAQFLAANDTEHEEKPLESLGFISVVQSDVSKQMEDETPEAAEILHRMIDNKEYYSGEDSRGFESKASYENHGFEVEDFSFNEYFDSFEDDINNNSDTIKKDSSVEYKVDDIFIKEKILVFEEISPEDIDVNNILVEEKISIEEAVPVEEEILIEEAAPVEEEIPIEEAAPVEEEIPIEETAPFEEEVPVEEEILIEETAPVEEEVSFEEEVPVEEEILIEEAAPVEEEVPIEEAASVEEEVPIEEAVPMEEDLTVEETSSIESDSLDYDGFISPEEEVIVVDESLLDEISDDNEFDKEFMEEQSNRLSYREQLRINIILTNQMVKVLLDLKESR